MIVVNFPSRRIKVYVDSFAMLILKFTLCAVFHNSQFYNPLHVWIWGSVNFYRPLGPLSENVREVWKKDLLEKYGKAFHWVKVGFSPKTIQHRASALSVTSYLSSRGLGNSECFNSNLYCQTLLNALQRPSHYVHIKLGLEESWCMEHVLPCFTMAKTGLTCANCDV